MASLSCIKRSVSALSLIVAAFLTACSGHGNSFVPGAEHALGGVKSPRALSAAAPALVQKNNGDAWAPASLAVSFTTAPASGDILVVFLHNNGNSSGGANGYTAPAGWTQIDLDTAHAYQTYEAFYHVAGVAEPTSYNFTPSCACKEHVWNALEVSGVNAASPIDKHGFGFPDNTTAWATPSETPSQAGDLAVVAMLPSTSSLTWSSNTSGWTVDSVDSVWSGEVLQEGLTTTAPVSESSTLSASSYGYAGVVLLNPATGTSSPSPSPPPTPTPPPSGSAPTLIQTNNADAWAPATLTVSYTAAPKSGDILVVFLHNNGNASGAANSYTAPAGWTQIDLDTAHAYQTYEAFYHVAGASEPTSYGFTPSCACKEHVWNALEFSGVNTSSPVDKHGFSFPDNTTSWTTAPQTPSQANELAVVAMLPSTNSLTWSSNTAGWTVDSTDSVWSGEVLQEALTSTAAVSESSTLSASSYGYAAVVLLNPAPVSALYSDWSTFGDNLQRTGYNPNEQTLTTTNVSNGLKVAWSTALGGAVTTQPILATGVSINGTPTNVLYLGAENNVFYALNADTGAILWQNNTLGTPPQVSCTDLPGDQFGVTGTATYDKSAGVVYVADGSDYVHALSMTTGVEQWKTNALYDPTTGTIVGAPNQDHIYAALTLNKALGLIYASTASFCDIAPWHGRVVAINTSTHAVTAAFFPGRSGSGQTGTAYCGGGIWGMGGAAIDPNTNDVFVATGNNEKPATSTCPADSDETYPYGDAVVELDPNLNLLSSQTATANGQASNDLDYGATPLLYSTSCGTEQTSAKNKDGRIYTYGESSALTFEQQLQVAPSTSAGQFVGVPAFDPTTGLLFVGNPASVGNFAHGLNAFTTSGCSGLTLAWKASIGSANATAQDNQAPTVANGIVFFTDGIDNQLWAFNDANGTVLWHSGTLMGSPCATYGTTCGVFSAPLVDGHVFVTSFNHNVYAFSL